MLENHIRAADSAGVPVLVRVTANQPVQILHALDAGAAGVIVPHVDTAEQAAAAVRAAHYPPHGSRGFALSTRAGRYGATRTDVHMRTAERTLVIAQIEDVAALPHVAAIAATPRLDAVWVGPSDLSLSLGRPGRPDHPDVLAAIDRIVADTHRAANAKLCVLARDEREAARGAAAARTSSCSTHSTSSARASPSWPPRARRTAVPCSRPPTRFRRLVDISASTNDPVYTGYQNKTILERFRLDGQAALVTGAGQGIGRAFAHALAEAGADVAVVDLDAAKAAAVAGELRAKGTTALALAIDVTDPDQVAEMVDRVVADLGGLHVAVNNAGVNRNSGAEDTSLSEWDEVFALNLRAVFSCCQAEARAMFRRGRGKIINTASMAALIVPHPQKQAAYNASKAGVVQLTRTLAAEWADRGVRVNCISPGIIRTALIDGNPALRPLVERWVADIPLGRLGEVTDLQAGLVYLACEASDYMTGHNLVIEGGQTLW
ncbi:SDR family oxidoreductase [Actinomadura madurae]|nr:glucose 1-dehydrogenase [Actinomadura madurae]MCP9977754.1 SDR family oxidoreductase [Actinomadura madurae]